MTHEEIQAIQEIQGTGGFRVIESLLEKKIAELDSVSSIDEKMETSVGVQALAKKYAVNIIKALKEDINLTAKPSTSKTYE